MEETNTTTNPDAIVQSNMRVRQADKEDFAAYCRENGITQADGLRAAMSALRLDATKRDTPDRAAEIDEVKKALDLVMSKYSDSIRYNTEAENRIRQEYDRSIQSKDMSIADLQDEKAKLTADLADAGIAVEQAKEAQHRAEEDAEHNRKTREAAEKTAEDKQRINDMLTSKLADAEARAAGYDDLSKKYDAAINAQKASEQALKDERLNSSYAAEKAKIEAEKAQERALSDARSKAAKQIDALKDQLRQAQTDAATAKAAAIAELSEKYEKTINDLRAKLDERTEALMQAKEEIASLRLEAKKEK